MRLLVIGYGNPLRRDDGFGHHVARRLAELLPEDRAEVIACHQLAPELAEPISRSDLVVFVDAHDGAEPGRVDWQAVAPATEAGAPFSHHLDPRALLAWARELYGACPPAVMVTVDGTAFGYGTGLSTSVGAIMPAVVEQIRRMAVGEYAVVAGDAE